jgi:sugar phosphate isomerase/epimerase
MGKSWVGNAAETKSRLHFGRWRAYCASVTWNAASATRSSGQQMFRLSINQFTTYRSTFEEDVLRCARFGVGGIGVWREKIDDYGLEKARELLREADVEVSNLLWAGGFTGSDGRSYRESLWDAARAIRLAGFLECPVLVLYSGGRGGHTMRHAHRLLTGALAALIPVAEEEGVQLALEPMHPQCAKDWTILTSLDDALRVIEELDHPQLKLVVDTYQLAEEPDVPEQIVACGDRIGIVHLGDARANISVEQNRCPLGKGKVDFDSIFAALTQIDYRGYLDLELFGEDVEGIEYSTLITSAQSMVREWTNVMV